MNCVALYPQYKLFHRWAILLGASLGPWRLLPTMKEFAQFRKCTKRLLNCNSICTLHAMYYTTRNYSDRQICLFFQAYVHSNTGEPFPKIADKLCVEMAQFHSQPNQYNKNQRFVQNPSSEITMS